MGAEKEIWRIEIVDRLQYRLLETIGLEHARLGIDDRCFHEQPLIAPPRQKVWRGRGIGDRGMRFNLPPKATQELVHNQLKDRRIVRAVVGCA